MGLFSGPRREVAESKPERALTVPWSPTTSTAFNAATVAGTGALASVAVRSATDLICSLVSELPCRVYRGDGSDREQITTPGNIEDPGDDGQGREDWIYRLVQSWLHRGNAYGIPTWAPQVNYAGTPRIRTLDLLDPDSVSATVDKSTGEVLWRVNGSPQPNLLHRRVNPMAGILLGFSPIEAHAVTILS